MVHASLIDFIPRPSHSLLGLKWHLESLDKTLREQYQIVAVDHFSMTLRQIRDQAHRIQTQDHDTTADSLKHKLEIFNKKFDFEILISPKVLLEKFNKHIKDIKGMLFPVDFGNRLFIRQFYLQSGTHGI